MTPRKLDLLLGAALLLGLAVGSLLPDTWVQAAVGVCVGTASVLLLRRQFRDRGE